MIIFDVERTAPEGRASLYALLLPESAESFEGFREGAGNHNGSALFLHAVRNEVHRAKLKGAFLLVVFPRRLHVHVRDFVLRFRQ